MKYHFFTIILFLCFFCSCSSLKDFKFNKATLISSVVVGAAIGAGVGALSAKKDESKLSWAVLGTGLGGTTGALSTSLFFEEENSCKSNKLNSQNDFFEKIRTQQLRNNYKVQGNQIHFQEGR